MSDTPRISTGLPNHQQVIRGRCFHPSRTFVEFRKDEIEQSIDSRFEQQMKKYPDRIAVKSRQLELTYSDLNRLGNRVAHAVQAQRGREKESIALLLGTVAPVIAAILGVLKAGKFYVTLDPLFPRSRIADMLEDSQAGVITTNGEHSAFVHELAQASRMKTMACVISNPSSGASWCATAATPACTHQPRSPSARSDTRPIVV